MSNEDADFVGRVNIRDEHVAVSVVLKVEVDERIVSSAEVDCACVGKVKENIAPHPDIYRIRNDWICPPREIADVELNTAHWMHRIGCTCAEQRGEQRSSHLQPEYPDDAGTRALQANRGS